jgi:hypothetical protein
MPVSNLKPLNLFSEGRRQQQTSPSSNNARDNYNGINNNNNGEKSTHIEVCARVRPLQISMLSSSSYFGGNEDHIIHTINNKKGDATTTTTSPARKPPLPRKPGIPTPGSAANQKKGGNESTPSSSSPPSHEELFYAWDVLGNDTASQSHKTDIVPGRTHQYTLDKVYGPSCTSKDLYNQSVRPLVSSAMEGKLVLARNSCQHACNARYTLVSEALPIVMMLTTVITSRSLPASLTH